MPELRYQADVQDIIVDLLTVQYRGLITDEMIKALLVEVASEDAERVLEAVRRHLRNTGLSRDREPVGKYPPSTADLLWQLQQLHVEDLRLAQEAENAKLHREFDASGERILRRIGWSQLTGEWGRKRSNITQALRQRLGLDLMRWSHCQILWQVHKAWADSCFDRAPDGIGWILSSRELSVSECVAVGERLWAEQAQEVQAEAAK